MDAYGFLDTLAGAAQITPERGSADRPTKFARIDPAYDPSLFPATLPRVIFDGESTLSEVRYVVIGSYWPYPGERVFLVPGGNSYVIVGALPNAVAKPGRDRVTATIENIDAERVILSVPHTFKGGWAYEVTIRGQVYGTAGVQAHFRLRKWQSSGSPSTWTDWGEYGRVAVYGPNISNSAQVGGDVTLLRTAATDLTATVALTCARNSGASGSLVNVFASTASPAYMIVKPLGPAVLYQGFGVEVS